MNLLYTSVSFSQTKNNQTMSLYSIEINSIDGTPINLNDYNGKYLLFVNVASECGFTGQYEDLQKLYDTYQDKLMVIGVPCNQFGSQEPGNSEQIQSFCKKNYGVTFLMTEKIDVKGDQQHPLYKWLTDKTLNGTKSTSVKWNFQKYLINENGYLEKIISPRTKPDDPSVIQWIKT